MVEQDRGEEARQEDLKRKRARGDDPRPARFGTGGAGAGTRGCAPPGCSPRSFHGCGTLEAYPWGDGERRGGGRRTSRRVVGPDDPRIFTDSGIEIEPLYEDGDVEPGLPERLGEPGSYPVHPRDPRGDVPLAALDDAPVRGLRDPRGHQRALPLPDRARLDRALDGLRPADPARPRLRRPDAARARSGAPASRSTRSRTCGSASTRSRSTRSRPR